MRKKAKRIQKKTATAQERSYREVVSIGGANSDWGLSVISEDSEIWQNAWALISRVRDLFRCNPLYQSYRETVWANIFGANGIKLRSKVKETEDRVVNTPDEKSAIRAYEERRNRVGEFYATRAGQKWKTRTWLHISGNNGSRVATVRVGDPDIYANLLIERAWERWQRMEFCDIRKARNYKTIRQLRLISAVRDGDFFIRMVMSPKVNKFGFALHLVNGEWCDRWLNCQLPNGNVVRMGIEYQWHEWGIGEPVAYYFIKRQPQDWQFSIPGAFNFSGPSPIHERVPAEQIIHYARATDADGTRPAPWVCSTIPSSRQLNEAMLAEVIAWRESACKMGWLYSDVVAEGGEAAAPPDPQKVRIQSVGPGDWRALPWGVKAQANNPTHPNANVKEFRMSALQNITSGMPGANYSTMANDYAAINFSAGRLQRLDTNETNMLLQQFDIDYAERPIFENWLYMALITGAIPLPLGKFDKFNSPLFQGRRWGGVDEVKEVTAAALRVANHFSSDQRECDAMGVDFEETLFEQAEANMLKEQLGMTVNKTVENVPPAQPAEDDESGETEGEQPEKKPKPKAKKSRLTAS